MITVKSIRYGHANNSSSSHSIVFLGDRKVKDDFDSGDFNWSFFTLSSRRAKEEYMFIQLMNYLPLVTKYSYGVIIEKVPAGFEDEESVNKYSQEYHQRPDVKAERMYQARLMLSEFSDTFKEIDLEEYAQKFVDNEDYGNVDHQSVRGFATGQDGALHYSFVRQFLKTIFENNFVILGGNDNDDNNHSEKAHHVENQFSRTTLSVWGFMRRGDIICYEDEINNDFILRNKHQGDKLRFSFEENAAPTEKSGFPELVDLKITNHCTYGCSFCYQSSTGSGKHAKTDDVKDILNMLANSKTFEIAIGGGEPTTHPEFVRILEHAAAKGMSVGFTTRNFKIDEVPGFNKIIRATDSIAFSCHTVKEIERVAEISDIINNVCKGREQRPVLYVQIIPELYSSKYLLEMLTACSSAWLKITLLGYKDFGFGKAYAPKNLNLSADWIAPVKEFSTKKHLQVGIDSVLVKKWKQELIKDGCNPLMLVGEEGKFSCYVDAVDKRIAKSSFTEESKPLDMSRSTILEEFKSF